MANDSDRTSFLLDFAIHGIDLVGYLFGDVRRVFAFARGLDAYAVSLQFANGAVGSLSFTDGRSFSVPTEEVEITIRGGNFMTISNSARWRITEGTARNEHQGRANGASLPPLPAPATAAATPAT